MLVLFVDQCQVSVIDQLAHLDLGGDHALWFQLACAEGIDDALEIFLLIAQDGFVGGFAEDEPVGVEGDLDGDMSAASNMMKG